MTSERAARRELMTTFPGRAGRMARLEQAWEIVNEWERDVGCPPTPFYPPFDPDLRLIGSSY